MKPYSAAVYKKTIFWVPRLPLRHRNMDPAPFRHPVDFFVFCPRAWQHFAGHCMHLDSLEVRISTQQYITQVGEI
jgi:hypothetical protein